MQIGDSLKELRKKQSGLTLKKLHGETGISIPYLSEIERNAAEPTIGTLKKLANYYKISLATLIDHSQKFQDEINDDLVPQGLREFTKEPIFKKYAKSNEKEWVHALMRVEFRGKRPEKKEEWEQLFLNLRHVFYDLDG